MTRAKDYFQRQTKSSIARERKLLPKMDKAYSLPRILEWYQPPLFQSLKGWLNSASLPHPKAGQVTLTSYALSPLC